MAIKHSYESTGRRTLEQIKDLKIIDIGGANSFAHGFLDALIDIRIPQAAAKNVFVGNIDLPDIWDKIKAHVKKNGKWDYAICTHTLEDINNPYYVCQQLEKIANAGLIVVPSKFREFSRFNSFRGFIHHRWIFDVIDGVLTGFPKNNFIEESTYDRVNEGKEFFEELIVEWEGEIGMKLINDGMPYGTATMSGDEHIRQLYKLLI